LHARKVLEMGGGTLLVSLPKQWAKKNGVTKGSTLAVDEISERKLLVHPLEETEEKPREVTVNYPQDELTYVTNDVTGSYLLGYETIHVRGSRAISREDRSRLKATIGKLIGLEIMDEDSKNMTLQFLLEPKGLDPGRVARRMAAIIGGMMKDTQEGVLAGDARELALVGERDDEVDRLYFLLVRAIRTATIDPEVAERYGLAPVEVLDYRVLASYLESVGDTVADLSRKLSVDVPPKESTEGLSRALELLQKMEELAVRSFMARRGSRAGGLYLEVEALGKQVGEALATVAGSPRVKTAKVVEQLGLVERASKLIVDISDLAHPGYQ
jgi:phosphate uptake regulator